MTSELRPTVEVAYEVWDLLQNEGADQAASAVIEDDREAVRAEQAAELAKWKALAETLEVVVRQAMRLWPATAREGVPAVWFDAAAAALTSYKEQRDA